MKTRLLALVPPMKGGVVGKRDFSALERRRMRAVQLLEQGLHPAEVARRVGVHRQSVGRWRKILEREGLAGMKQAQRAGRRPKLNPDDLGRLEEALIRGPKAWGYSTERWTTQRVAELIQKLFQVQYHPGHVGRVLGRMNWSCQAPMSGVKEGEEAMVRRWRRMDWPSIKEKIDGRRLPYAAVENPHDLWLE